SRRITFIFVGLHGRNEVNFFSDIVIKGHHKEHLWLKEIEVSGGEIIKKKKEKNWIVNQSETVVLLASPDCT
ncbi:hypothetical protein ACJX0J_021795, partial [Zea mays]